MGLPALRTELAALRPGPRLLQPAILARTAHTDSNGSVQVSPWFDLAAVDDSAVEHHAFPSHTAQNLLRRAWTSYVEHTEESDTATLGAGRDAADST